MSNDGKNQSSKVDVAKTSNEAESISNDGKIRRETVENVINDGRNSNVSVSGEIRSKCLGYEIGNAIESLSNYEIQHGLALAQGIGIVANASAKMEWCNEDTKDRIINTLKRNDLPVTGEKCKFR